MLMPPRLQHSKDGLVIVTVYFYSYHMTLTGLDFRTLNAQIKSYQTTFVDAEEEESIKY